MAKLGIERSEALDAVAMMPWPDDADEANDRTTGNGAHAAGHTALLQVADIGSVFDFDAGGVEFVVQGVFPKTAIICISGESGSGKTTLIHAAGHARSVGYDFAGLLTEPGPVVVFDRENPLGFTQERNTRLGIVDGTGFKIWGGWQPEQAPDPSVPRIMEWAAAQDPKPLIIIDSLIAFLEGDENSSTEVRACFQRWRALANLGCTIIVIHHSGKGENTKDYRGSSDIKASVDVGYSLANIGSDPNRLDTVRLRCWKSRVLVESELVLRFVDGTFERVNGSSQTRTNHDIANEVLRAHPGLNSGDLEELITRQGVSQKQARQITQGWQSDPRVLIVRGERNARIFSWKGDADDLFQ